MRELVKVALRQPGLLHCAFHAPFEVQGLAQDGRSNLFVLTRPWCDTPARASLHGRSRLRRSPPRFNQRVGNVQMVEYTRNHEIQEIFHAAGVMVKAGIGGQYQGARL